ncbi:MAG: penicillin-insensitive murein endopeptidase [Sandaracinaceae bacterium]|nr:penicillin-insensitive murein endopeptidase [Sandaracinaceae bacterium]
MHHQVPRLIALASVLLAATAAAQDAPPNTSVGDTHDGHLVGGAELPRSGPGFHWETNRGNPGARYGATTLVDALQAAAASVLAAHPGSDLAIHDIALRDGGPIRGHGSHRSGRDVDIAYYARTPDGAPMNPTRSIWFVSGGRERGAPAATGATFHAERTFAFLRALLTDRTIRVSHVFMAPHLQRLVLAAGGRDAAVPDLRRVLRRPRGRRVDPHADHFHVRIHCPPSDTRFCED